MLTLWPISRKKGDNSYQGKIGDYVRYSYLRYGLINQTLQQHSHLIEWIYGTEEKQKTKSTLEKIVNTLARKTRSNCNYSQRFSISGKRRFSNYDMAF